MKYTQYSEFILIHLIIPLVMATEVVSSSQFKPSEL